MVRPAERRIVVKWMVDQKQISQRKACRWVGLSRNAVAEPAVIKEKDKVLAGRIELCISDIVGSASLWILLANSDNSRSFGHQLDEC